MSESELEALKAAMLDCGQHELWKHLEQLDQAAQKKLADQCKGLDWPLMAALQENLKNQDTKISAVLEPAATLKKGHDVKADQEAKLKGEELLNSGRVALFVVAGGQGSRLGFDGPKGMFPATPIRERNLFQVFAAKVEALSRRAKTAIPWFVMTSQANHEATSQYFESQDYFGLPKDKVFLFKQDMLPAMDPQGKLLLAARDSLFLSPNGHGGSLLALASSGALKEMKQQGIDEIFYFQVDNPLVVMADPVFLGYHHQAGAQMSTKVVPKRDAQEKVGVVGLIDGRYGVIEYSDLSAEELAACDESGQLKFQDGNIAVHLIRRDFVETLTQDGLNLPYHLARKKIACFEPEQGQVQEIDGVKFETFVFDALADCESSVVLSVDRAEEFSPIKNAEGQDSPATSRQDQSELHAAWLESMGAKLPRDSSGKLTNRCEIDPRVGDNVETLRSIDGLIEGLDLSRDILLD